MKGLPSVDRAIRALSRFPGVGPKSAQRMIFHLLRGEDKRADELIHALEGLRDQVGCCRVCHNLAEGERCWVCEDHSRDDTLLCVVEESVDLMAMERAGLYRGVYHVLGGRLNPLEGVEPEHLSFASLQRRLEAGVIKEVVIATNPTVEGEATAHYISQIVTPYIDRVTRLAYGLPMGGELEYLDESTLYQALAGRRSF
ncbi:MAG: recombination protein RecR [Magnetococcales bacterium]|nr:recombination protein RecR [Magnetococcales bacterium]